MAYREVHRVEIREVIRRWQAGLSRAHKCQCRTEPVALFRQGYLPAISPALRACSPLLHRRTRPASHASAVGRA